MYAFLSLTVDECVIVNSICSIIEKLPLCIYLLVNKETFLYRVKHLGFRHTSFKEPIGFRGILPQHALQVDEMLRLGV